MKTTREEGGCLRGELNWGRGGENEKGRNGGPIGRVKLWEERYENEQINRLGNKRGLKWELNGGLVKREGGRSKRGFDWGQG